MKRRYGAAVLVGILLAAAAVIWWFRQPQRPPSIMEKNAYAAARPDVAFANQSGPMPVIDGQSHPRFEKSGTSRYTRNGVGVRDGDIVVLAISRSQVSLGSFACPFRDALNYPNALFLDGAVSALSNGQRMLVGGNYPARTIIAVSAKTPAAG
ncbi:phosphodiester glycosidase family protein [Mesorhizobium cantuariense]|uniref:Phosphodiester glycosidase family protein n=1 Tax=Mesorhizobium cantuariense TaxID=1300275 RepID=A0ABV7MLQ5_9HYPH